MTVEFLEAQRSRFAGQGPLFDYLLAARAWFVDKDAAAVLQLLPATAPGSALDYLGFSRQLLRAAALDATGDPAVGDIYAALIPAATKLYQRPTLELALAKHYERHKNITAAFAEGTLIQDADVRIKLLDLVAGPIILRQQALSQTASAAERDAALYRLLVRDVIHGRFKGFLEDIKLLPPIAAGAEDAFAVFRWNGQSDDGYACPGLTEVAKLLSANARSVKGRLCLGEFLRSSYISTIETPGANELGGTGTLFAGKVLARHDFYTSIIADPKASRRDRAYALFRAVHCYESVGNNDCGGEAVDRSQRKKWFNELKAGYADTQWAKSLRYYW